MNRDNILKQLSVNNADVIARVDELVSAGATNEKFCVDLIESEITNGKLNKRPKKIRCELLDKINYMCRKYMDRMERLEFTYDFIVDEESYKTAVMGLLEKAYVFRSKVVYSPISPYWKPMPYHIDEVVTSSEEEPTMERKNAFFTQEIPADNNTQLKMHLFYHEGKTTVCYLVSHMCVDGTGYFTYVAHICSNYTKLVQNGISPIDYSQGPRDFDQVYSDFSKEKRKKAKALFTNPASKVKNIFPYTPESKDDKPILTRCKINSEVFNPALAVAKKAGCSGNDLLITAYMCAYKKLSGISGEDTVNVTTAVDLRRYIKDPSKLGYTNEVSFINCTVDKVGETPLQTLEAVKQAGQKYKNDEFMGLYGVPLLDFAYKSMVYAQAEPIIKMCYSNPSLSVSNLGVVKAQLLSMDGNEPLDMYASGAAKRKPCAVATIGSFKGDLCISISFFGTEEDRKIVENFYKEFENALIEIAK